MSRTLPGVATDSEFPQGAPILGQSGTNTDMNYILRSQEIPVRGLERDLIFLFPLIQKACGENSVRGGEII